jgi:SAM-dependent methyltransferase
VPVAARRIRGALRRRRPIRFGSFRRLSPISRNFGFDRGTPVDRYYVHEFLRRYAGHPGYVMGDIRGRVLEIGEDLYTREFGRWGEPDSYVEKADILHVDEANPDATFVGDLTDVGTVPADTFDCLICTQTLHLIYDVKTAVANAHRLLKPGGVLLATVPGISQVCRPDIDLWGDYWRFTTHSARRLMEEVFPPENVRVEAYGNVLSSMSFLQGLAAEDLRPDELDARDPDYELLITVRAIKQSA